MKSFRGIVTVTSWLVASFAILSAVHLLGLPSRVIAKADWRNRIKQPSSEQIREWKTNLSQKRQKEVVT